MPESSKNWAVMFGTPDGLEWYPSGHMTLEEAIAKARSCLRWLRMCPRWWSARPENVHIVVPLADGTAGMEDFTLRLFYRRADF